MKKVILIDDERPALIELDYLLKQYKDVSIAGMFTNPLEALEEMKFMKPDVVFLDIHMPQLKGIDAASAILDIDPSIDIVFVTAFDQYAVEAFEIHALDYLLKPISDERFAKTMDRVMKKTKAEPADSGRFHIKCLGGFQAGWEGHEAIKWRAEKTKEKRLPGRLYR